MRIQKLLIAVVVLLVLMFPVWGATGSMRLLAVSGEENALRGMVADLSLEIQPGSGRVFIDTFPLTKLDTQISIRFAKEVACDFVGVDCSRYDFFYTIRANAPIIGGASAGSAVSALTAAMLKGLPVNDTVAVTGTINSGGIIGPVGGLTEKITAAADDGVKMVIVPSGQMLYTPNLEENRNNSSNVTTNETEINLTMYAQEQGITIIGAESLDDVVTAITGVMVDNGLPKIENLVIDPTYAAVMANLSIMLCNRSETMREGFIGASFTNASLQKHADLAQNLTQLAKNASFKGQYYAAASYCFGANTNYQYLFTLEQNYSAQELEIKKEELLARITEFNELIEKKELSSITDLETYMIVKERLDEAEDILNNEPIRARELAYAKERVYSAFVWGHFFDTGGKKLSLDEDHLRESCLAKIGEAQERLQYVLLYLPGLLEDVEAEIADAGYDYNNKQYEMCLFRASKAKAQADVVVSLLGVKEGNLKNMFTVKKKLVKGVIAHQQEEGFFPILGYSYYEYATSLEEEDISSAFLYLEYALELSKVDIYFKNGKQSWSPRPEHKRFAGIFVAGVVTGVLCCLPALRRKREQQIRQRKKK
ncbi:hypothetical protein HZB01_00440 [Candidatus Woesearchaeota archaeon]|nr:hypothetical protein [Candidatus Woesearchaeota archaeon]